MQVPDPSLVQEIGVVSWMLVAITMSGATTIAFFLHRITKAMDRMAAAQEATPALVAKLETLLAERFERIEQKIDKAVDLASEHVRIGRKWEDSEAPGRIIRPEHNPR